MIAEIRPTGLEGQVLVPASKSHTIRALLIATLAQGVSIVANPLDSKDARSCIDACRILGAEITELPGGWQGWSRALQVRGIGTPVNPPSDILDVGNSGTTEYLMAGIAALAGGYTVFTGDHQIRNRPVENLLAALRDLGATAFTTRGNGAAPFVVGGPITGGSTSIECPTSQFLSSLLLALPLAQGESRVEVPLLHEKPYAEMTLRWLEEQGIQFRNDNWKSFVIPGGQHYTPFQKAVPGDFSSATFFAAAAAITGASIELEGLDMADSQGDKLVFLILSKMGCRIDYLKGKTLIAQAGGTSDTDDAESAYTQAISQGTDGIRVCGPSRMGRPLRGGRFDLNSIPDALPALAVVACFSVGQVELVNVPQARLKETDRISVMTQELGTMGATIQELEDGMIITPTRTPEGLSGLVGAEVQGHDDHRVVMSLAVAGLVAQGSTRIIGAEAAAVTYPGFFDTLRSLSSDSKALALS